MSLFNFDLLMAFSFGLCLLFAQVITILFILLSPGIENVLPLDSDLVLMSVYRPMLFLNEVIFMLLLVLNSKALRSEIMVLLTSNSVLVQAFSLVLFFI